MIRKATDFIVVHCSATRPGMDIGADEIRVWHKQKGWSDIGYHYVIRRNGKIELGRRLEVEGAHVQGHNHHSVGICLVGGIADIGKPHNNFTPDQMMSLLSLLDDLKGKYPDAKIQGHRDFPGVAKACPSFDVRKWLNSHREHG